jgi:L-arabinokinase
MTLESSRFATPHDAEEQWAEFVSRVQTEFRDLFDGDGPVAGARAPGRLDVMGGVADYSGSTVLEMPIAHAACVAWQWRSDRLLKIVSPGLEADGLNPEVVISLDEMVDAEGRVRPPEEVRERLNRDPASRWASYVAGCFYVMLVAHSRLTQGHADPRIGEQGANVLLISDVPLGAGVSSSAAVEVATMLALAEAAGIMPSDLTLAAWCQRAENLIVGAPCGIMDQVTSALGRENALIVLKCQPHDLLGAQHIPPGWRFLGIDSRVKHSVAGRSYTRARVGAFMGLKIIQLESGGKLLDNYLCKMNPDEFAEYRDMIPASLTGAEYQREYGLLPDTVTRVDPEETYRPRACAEHPILENHRVQQFVGLMHIATLQAEQAPDEGVTYPGDKEMMIEAGKLMYEAHKSYSDRLDLGSPETDLLVELIATEGPDQGLYGAKITGGGGGGTVAVLCEAGSDKADVALERVMAIYEQRTGIRPGLIVGSSPGAVMFGARDIERG